MSIRSGQELDSDSGSLVGGASGSSGAGKDKEKTKSQSQTSRAFLSFWSLNSLKRLMGL